MSSRRPGHHCGLWSAAILAVSGCSAGAPRQPAPVMTLPAGSLTYPSIDRALGEVMAPSEQAAAEAISRLIEASLQRQYSPGLLRRDAHPKAHGCVKAEFHVLDHLPAALVSGIFIPGKSYQAWIRFSNGSSNPQAPDIKRDARGMAIKVMGISGSSLLTDAEGASTQDFILINHPVFFASNPQRYLSFMRAVSRGDIAGKLMVPFALGARGTVIALQTLNSRISNPLQTRYWSMVPYQLGTGTDRQAVKYSARSCSAAIDPMPDKPAHDFLRDALRHQLQQGDACMELMVQPRTSRTMSVEDSMREWPEGNAPFYPVARLHIRQQVFDTPAQNASCERLAFNPWHALPEHRPLGSMNRLRKIIYDHTSRARHASEADIRPAP